MDSLPEELYGEIMQYLSITDVFSNYCLINHNFLSTTKSLYNLSRYLCNVYHLSAYYQATREQLIQYFNWALHTKSMQNLEFTGFATSGGVDDDRSLWWVDSLFHENGPGYCARDNKLNINVAGVLLHTNKIEN